ncbi:hypothetical protein K474DRAFT_1636710 [Panus rudis PR-1116 ss-1]|nr:hypothetical protein K474DRAFT_1636710 [Panus rudis PR-1116 ss-1]
MPLPRAVKGKKRAYVESTSESEHEGGTSSRSTPAAYTSSSSRSTPIASASTSTPSTSQPLPTQTPTPTGTTTHKKSKRAITKKCPICSEEIPIRLLEAHASLESQRVDEIISSIGSTEVLGEAQPDDGVTARTRKSAVRARQSIKVGAPKHKASALSLGRGRGNESVDTEVVESTLRLLKRRRKQRHAKLREMTREDDDSIPYTPSGDGTICPVCMKSVPGDPDVVEAHVDACLANEARLAEEREREQQRVTQQMGEEDIDIGGEVRMRVTDGVNFRGSGFDVRNNAQQDVEDDIDIDGEDEAIYGAPQFTESDILATVQPSSPSHDQIDIDVEGDGDDNGAGDVHLRDNDESGGEEGEDGEAGTREKTLRDLVAEGKVLKRRPVDGSSASRVEAIHEVKKTMDEVMGVGEAEEVDVSIKGDSGALIQALENKVKLLESTRISSSTSLLCRICIDPYNEPTVSTGCWHTCCRECWLRCLASTKLCPICKRITSASDLRRIYL